MKKLSGLVCAAYLASPSVFAVTHEVCSSGCPHTIISQALSAAQDGDTVFVHDGNYLAANMRISQRNITIEGESERNTVIDAANVERHFVVDSAGTATFRNLTLKNGRAVLPTSLLGVPPSCDFSEAGTPCIGDGGSICSIDSPVVLDHVSFINNKGISRGGAVHVRGVTSMGVAPQASLRVLNSTFINNRILPSPVRPGLSRGGAISCDRCELVEIYDSHFERNRSYLNPGPTGAGGAVSLTSGQFCDTGGQMQPISSHGVLESGDNRFLANSAGHAGGAIFISNVHPAMNQAFDYSLVDSSHFEGNQSGGDGGAILMESAQETGNLWVRDTFFGRNSASARGGVLATTNSGFFVDNSTVVGNRADDGGAFSVHHAVQASRLFSASNVTFVGNRTWNAQGMGSVWNVSSGAPFNLTRLHMSNSILSENALQECRFLGQVNELRGQNNLTDGSSCNSDNSSATGSPSFPGEFSLGPVSGLAPRYADNGGNTLTYAISSRSNAVNAAADACASASLSGATLNADQRGAQRKHHAPRGWAACDIGAYEYQPPRRLDERFDRARRQ